MAIPQTSTESISVNTKTSRTHRFKYLLFGMFLTAAVTVGALIKLGVLDQSVFLHFSANAINITWCTNNSGSIDIPVDQCEALVALYNNTNGDNWTNKSDW